MRLAEEKTYEKNLYRFWFFRQRKGSLVNKIMEKRSDIKVVKSYTTRPKRSEDDFYNFVSEAEFDELERNNLLLESNTYNGFRYGTLVADDRNFKGIYWDGASHFYIDGSITRTKKLLCLAYDEDEKKYYEFMEDGTFKKIGK